MVIRAVNVASPFYGNVQHHWNDYFNDAEFAVSANELT